MSANDDLSDVRERLEDVAVLFCSDHGGTWVWEDPEHMHLTIHNEDGTPYVTLHVERTQ